MKEKDNKAINWNTIHTTYKKLVGEENYKKYANPFCHDIKNNRWFIDLSERDTGKTTNTLLLALIVYIKYGYSYAYIRSDTQQLTVSKLQNLYNVITDNDYINKLTNGQYNDIFYDRIKKVWYLVNNETLDKDDNICCYGLSVHAYDEYKSTLNLPKCEIFIFDEFINQYCGRDDFIKLCHLMSTVFRHRKNNPRVFLLANTLTKYHFFFSELGIQKIVKYIKLDEVKEIITDKGTHVSVRLIKNNNNEVKKQVNSLLYGFNNPLLNSITGGEWDIENYPHLERELADITEYLEKNIIVVNFLDEYYSIDNIMINGMCYAYVHNITKEKYNGKIFMLCEYPYDNRIPLEYIIDKLNYLQRYKLVFFQDNEVGDLFTNSIDYFKNK